MIGFVSETLALVSGRDPEILAALGITPPRSGAHIHCPFPHHRDRHPSWRWEERTARWHCTCGTGDSIDLVIQMGHAASPVEAAIYIREMLGLPGGRGRKETPAETAARQEQLQARLQENERRKAEADADYAADSERLLALALALYARGAPAAGTIVENYLRSRGIEVIPDLARLVEYRRLPVMCMPFGIPDEPEPSRLSIRPERIAGVHLTFLQADGSGKAKDAKGRSKIMIGRGHDFPLVLAPVNDLCGLVIAEGIEDALTVHQLTGLGAWAAGSSSRLYGIAKHVPAYVDCVTLIEDNNEAGRNGCRALAEDLHVRGVEVILDREAVRHAA